MFRRSHVALVAACAAFAACGSDSKDEGAPSNAGGNDSSGGGGETIKVGFLSDCEGAFGSFFEPTASGANLKEQIACVVPLTHSFGELRLYHCDTGPGGSLRPTSLAGLPTTVAWPRPVASRNGPSHSE